MKYGLARKLNIKQMKEAMSHARSESQRDRRGIKKARIQTVMTVMTVMTLMVKASQISVTKMNYDKYLLVFTLLSLCPNHKFRNTTQKL